MMEPDRDRQKVWWAVLASIAAHLLVGLSLAAFAGGQPDITLPEDVPPPKLTIMDLPEPTPPPLVPKNAPTTTVDPDRKSAEAPKEKTFEANENSIAAAEKAATEDNQLPGQDGKERPFMNLEEHANSFASADPPRSRNPRRPRRLRRSLRPAKPPPRPRPRLLRINSPCSPRRHHRSPLHPKRKRTLKFPHQPRRPRRHPNRASHRSRPRLSVTSSRRRLFAAESTIAAVRR